VFLDGVYLDRLDGSARFHWVSSTTQELTQLSQTIARRVGQYLEHHGLLERDAENSYLASYAASEDPMDQLLGHSITYRQRMIDYPNLIFPAVLRLFLSYREPKP
jgi:hypothetical protein